MPTAVEILSTTLVEYPKNPSTGLLVRLLKRAGPTGGTASEKASDYTIDNACLCLLGHVGFAGGATLKELSSNTVVGGKTYQALLDGNGIEEAVRFLFQAITGVDPHSRATEHLFWEIYTFNDAVLGRARARIDGERPEYTPESIAAVTAKIQEALDLAIAAEEPR